ncbi:MAG TPA: hypothetical protein VK206_26560 [Anaerolineales bacterium]|nr:hypothetical protein [Anaerolineales bacterium]
MNNNLYHWHAEEMVKYEMQEIEREIEQARLLKEAGLDRPSLLARAVRFLHNLLKARRNTVRVPRNVERRLISSPGKTECNG